MILRFAVVDKMKVNRESHESVAVEGVSSLARNGASRLRPRWPRLSVSVPAFRWDGKDPSPRSARRSPSSTTSKRSPLSPAQHRTRRRWPHRALGNARLVVDGLGNGAAHILPQLAAAEDDFGGLERSNRALAFAFDEDLIYMQGLAADNQTALGGISGDDLDL